MGTHHGTDPAHYVIVLLFGGGGYYGHRRGYYGGISLIGVLAIVLIVFLLFGSGYR